MRAETLKREQAWCGLGAARTAGQWEAGHGEPPRVCKDLVVCVCGGGVIHTMRSNQWV